MKHFLLAALLLGLCIVMGGNNASAEMSASTTTPKQGASVVHGTKIEGTCSNVPGNRYLWAVVKPEVSPRIHPQSDKPDHGALTKGCNGSWKGTAYFGANPESNIGERFALMIVAVDDKGNNVLKGYLSDPARKDGWPGLDALPVGAKVLDKINVTRK